ncbi:MAG: tetratricopeptide repeat protein, partial [Myxococcota bacterium]
SRSVVKKSFFALSKKYHPDRFFGKELGPYKQRLERVFTGLKLAYDTLGHPKKKKAYVASHPAPSEAPYSFVPGLSDTAAAKKPANKSPKPAPVATQRPVRAVSSPRPAPAPAAHRPAPRVESRPRTAPAAPMDPEMEKRLEERRRQIMAQRRARGGIRPSPGMSAPAPSPASNQQTEKAGAFYADGLQQLRDGDAIGAEASFKMALAHAPDNAEYRLRFEEASAQASTLRASKRVGDAKKKESFGDIAGAAEDWASASDLVSSNTRYALRAAECFIEMHDGPRAWRFAERALGISGERLDVLLVAAVALLENGERSRAKPYVEKARALEPHDPRVKKLVARVLS